MFKTMLNVGVRGDAEQFRCAFVRNIRSVALRADVKAPASVRRRTRIELSADGQ